MAYVNTRRHRQHVVVIVTARRQQRAAAAIITSFAAIATLPAMLVARLRLYYAIIDAIERVYYVSLFSFAFHAY